MHSGRLTSCLNRITVLLYTPGIVTFFTYVAEHKHQTAGHQTAEHKNAAHKTAGHKIAEHKNAAHKPALVPFICIVVTVTLLVVCIVAIVHRIKR